MASPLFTSSSAVHTDIFEACQKGRLSEIRKFIREGCSFNILDSVGGTPLMYAAACKTDEVFKKVLAQTSEEYLHKIDQQGQNVLFYACSSNALSRVSTLCKDKAVKVTRASNGKMPESLSTNSEIEKFLHGAILTDAFKKHRNWQAVNQEVYERTGEQLVVTSPEKLEAHVDYFQEFLNKMGKDLKDIERKMISEPRIQQEMREMFTAETPLSVTTARHEVGKKFGVTLSKSEMQEILDKQGISTKKELLNSKETRRAIAKHFKEHRPKSVDEAIKYIKDQYDYTCEREYIIKFLEHFGIIFEAEAPGKYHLERPFCRSLRTTHPFNH